MQFAAFGAKIGSNEGNSGAVAIEVLLSGVAFVVISTLLGAIGGKILAILRKQLVKRRKADSQG